jgi:iron complex outermembrane receptor protein
VSDEIVVDTSGGGRNTFKNAAHTRRKGIEIGWQARLPGGFEAVAAYTHLAAEFAQGFSAGAASIPAGNRIPGVPSNTLYTELVWRDKASGFHAGIESRYNGRVYVDDANSESAASYFTANVRAGFEQRYRRWRFAQFVRVDNVGDKDYVGSIIVADANRRFYEPAPGRNWLAGVSAEVTF